MRKTKQLPQRRKDAELNLNRNDFHSLFLCAFAPLREST